MARIDTFQGGRVQIQPGTGERVRAPDYGPGIAPVALATAGKAIGDYAEKVDQIEEVNARVEANRLAVEHSELTRKIGNGVKQTLGEGATAAADQGIAELDEATKALIARASPRAKMMLESELGQRLVVARDGFLDHGFGQKVKAFETTSEAKIAAIAEEATDEDDEDRGLELLRPAGEVIDQQAQFFGKGAEWATAKKREIASGYFKSRSLKLATGPNGSALAAIEYATKHRATLTDQDYNAIVSSYNDNALDEAAEADLMGAPQPSATTAPAEPVAEGEPSTRRLDPTAFFNAFTVPHEGSTYVVDSNGAGVKYGINAEYNPGVDVKNLTQPAAAAIFRKKYFEKSGADKLPPALAAVHVDTFYLNERKAASILKESGGDVDRYIALRNQFLNGLATNNPAKFGKYKRGWQNRTNALAEFANRQGGDGQPRAIAIGPDTSLTDFRAQTMARTDIGMALKTKILQRAEGIRTDARQEKAVAEQASYDVLTNSALQLGDGFTDVSQLPQNVWVSASPQVRTQFTNMAKGNRENKPLTPELAAYIEFTEVSNPRKFATKEFLTELTQKGVPLNTIRTVAARQGRIAGMEAAKTPQSIADGSLWTVAKPAFEASGLFFDTLEEKGKKREVENVADAMRKQQAVGFLRDMSVRWSQANPGKTPDAQTVRQWVGYSLRSTSRGRGYELNDEAFYDRLDPAQRVNISREFIKLDPSWAKKPASQRIRDVVSAARDRAATGR